MHEKESMNMRKEKSQKSEVLKYMTSHAGITSIQAFEKFGVTRLSDIIFRLRKDGYDIETEDITTKNRYGHSTTYAKYRLV